MGEFPSFFRVVFPVSGAKGLSLVPHPRFGMLLNHPQTPGAGSSPSLGSQEHFATLAQALGWGMSPFGSIPRNWHAFPRRVWDFGGGNAQVGEKKKKPTGAGPKGNLKVFTKSRAAKNNRLIF